MSEVAVIGDYGIRDKKLADAGTGTSVALTDAVVLKDTNGNYVEIDRDSFTDAVRSALGPILTNMTQKTAASGGVVVNDSNDVGTMNLSNLASALGEHCVQIRQMSRSDDITWPLGLSIQYNDDRIVFSVVREEDLVGFQIKLDFASSSSDAKLQWRYKWPTLIGWRDF